MTKRAWLVFGGVWSVYCVVYCLRKPVGVIKSELAANFHLSKTSLGWLDLSLLLAYATAQIAFSSTWDTLASPRLVIGLCLSLTSTAMMLLGASLAFWFVCLCLLISGAAQAPIWPACARLLSAWFPKEKQSSVFGAVSTAPYAGAVIGTAVAVFVQDHYSWRCVFVPAGVLGLVLTLALQTALKLPSDSPQSTESTSKTSSFLDLWRIPGVAETTIAVFCLKFVRYCMYMWSPLYLIEHLGYDRGLAGFFSTAFDVGGIVGGPLIGFIVDKYFSDKPVFGVYVGVMLGTFVFVFMTFMASWGGVYCAVLLALAGAANCGPDALLTGSVTSALGAESGQSAGVTSLVNGVGSVGGIVEGPVVGLVSTVFGWSGVIVLMIAMSFAATLATLKAHLVLRLEEKRKKSLPDRQPLINA